MMNYAKDRLDSISITWDIDDVKSLDSSLTDIEAREVLARAYLNHDANIGISWDILAYWINEVKEV